MDDNRVEVTFQPGLTSSHIDELLFFKDMILPDYLKFFYQQTNGVLIESSYFLDELEDAFSFRVLALEHLTFTTKKLNLLPDRRFIHFADDEEEAIYLLDMENLSPEGQPLILLNIPSEQFCIPLTNSFERLLESASLGLLAIIQTIGGNEKGELPIIPSRMLKQKEWIKACLKDFFIVAKREYDLLTIWHLSSKAERLVRLSIVKWLKGLKELLTMMK
ncbi:MAG: SMI1/KNR4 family protein [Candidatus Heimdallarchaeota archaeon]|nr:SMI1/KNR4 family protein [Candidatus Heimdallarchaeota archaeon]